MNWQRIGDLIRLRYKLMWARTRQRNGKIALLVLGYLLVMLVAAVVGAGGLGAGIAAIRSGRAERMLQQVLSGLMGNAIFGTVVMGFGLNAVFSESELRRFPLRHRERFLARHVLGIADPFWLLILALEAGLVVGLYVYGTYSFWYGAAAVLLSFVCGYLLTRVVGVWAERLMNTRSGSMVAMGLIMAVSLLPGVLVPVLKKNPALVSASLAVLRYTPPFGAAAAMTHEGWAALNGLGLIVAWAVVLAAALLALERRPAGRRQAARTAGIAWDGPLDRLTAPFGGQTAPLVAFWLRFYLRNSRFRMLYLFSMPLAAFLIHQMGQVHKAMSPFVAAAGILPFVAFMGTSRIAVNQYGYVGGAFRRFFLFPTDPGASLRAGSYAGMLLGGALIPPAVILWAVFAPRPFDWRMVAMPAIDAVAALCWFHGAGLWTTLYGPRRGEYDKTLGNDLSLAGNILLIGTVLACMFLPMALGQAVCPANWWISLPLAALAVAFYAASLRGATAAFSGRRERLLALLEGKA